MVDSARLIEAFDRCEIVKNKIWNHYYINLPFNITLSLTPEQVQNLKQYRDFIKNVLLDISIIDIVIREYDPRRFNYGLAISDIQFLDSKIFFYYSGGPNWTTGAVLEKTEQSWQVLHLAEELWDAEPNFVVAMRDLENGKSNNISDLLNCLIVSAEESIASFSYQCAAIKEKLPEHWVKILPEISEILVKHHFNKKLYGEELERFAVYRVTGWDEKLIANVCDYDVLSQEVFDIKRKCWNDDRIC